MLDILDAMAERLLARESVPAADAEGSIEFLRVFVDQCHHTKEEKLLFPAMRAAGVTAAESTIVALLADHEHGRAAVAGIAGAVGRLALNDDHAGDELAALIYEYTHLLREHISREERSCFDVADRDLPVTVRAELVEGYERIEREVVGEGRHEAFHALLDRLDQGYGSGRGSADG